MIKLIPIEASEQLQSLCRAYGLEQTEDMHAYMSADAHLKAQCIFSLKNYRVSLLAIDFDDTDPLVPELLIRAVGAYAANRSGYLFTVAPAVGEPIAQTLQTLRFEKNENGYCGKVPKILEGSCRCKNNNN